jgi:tetratricopeptide (TPR) repeat protein
MTPLNSILCLADAHFAREDWTSARDSLRAALEIAPAHPQLLATLGNLHFLLKEFAEACTAFSAAARQRPGDMDLLLRLAMTHRELHQLDAAEAVLGRILARRPDDLSVIKLLADCYRDQRRTHDAAAIYGALLERNFEPVAVLLALGKLLADVADWAGARAAWERVLQLDPDNDLAEANLRIVKTKPARKSYDYSHRHAAKRGWVNAVHCERHFVRICRRPPVNTRHRRQGT